MNPLTRHIDQIKKLCSSNKVRTLFVFGSAVREDFKIESDIDLVVDIDEKDPLKYSDNYFNLKFQLEQLFNRKVDLLEQHAIKNPHLLERIDQTKMILYG